MVITLIQITHYNYSLVIFNKLFVGFFFTKEILKIEKCNYRN